MQMLSLIAALCLDDKMQYQIKSMQREVLLTDGLYYKEINRLNVQVLSASPEKEFYYAVPFQFWEKVSFTYARNLRTNEPLTTSVVRRDEFHRDLFFLKITLDTLPDAGENLMLFVEFHAAPGARYTSKFTSLLTEQSGDERMAKEDRRLESVFAANCPQIYDISTQKTVIKLPPGTYVNHSTPHSPVFRKGDKIEIGPNEYATPLDFENITVLYSAEAPTLAVEMKRSVFASGLPIRVGDFENQLTKVHVVDEINLTNTDPAPQGLRESRYQIYQMNQLTGKIVHDIAFNLQKATNINVRDRVGKIASVKKYNGPEISQVTVHPRHDLFGQQRSQVIIEYDVDVVRQDGARRGFVMPPAPRISPTPYFTRMEVCVFPPSTAKNVEYSVGYPIDYEYEETAQKALDMSDRHGVCFGRKLADIDHTLKNFGVSYEIDQELVARRFATFAIGIAVAMGAAWFFRLIL